MNLSDRQGQLDDLLAECSRTFLTTPAGEEARLAYLRARVTAEQNYAAVSQLDTQGIDITDAVLLKLLPHTDTELHRTQGAWLHPAAYITGDLRRWYEASGMTRRGAWPLIARAIWQLIQRCINAPDELDEACRHFAAEPATKGFQTGIITPILNALDAEHFCLLSRKSRATLNFFTHGNHGHTMLDYPAANVALQRFLDSQPNLRQLAHALEMHPGDLFDLFSYWLVSVRRFVFHPTTYWRLTLEDDPALWIEWQEGGYVAMGWDEMGDVGAIGQGEFHARRDSLLEQYPNWRKGELNQLWRFAHQLHEGDKVMVTGAQNRVLGHGTLVGPYYFVNEVGLGHRRPVEWDDLTPRQSELPDAHGLIRLQSTAFNNAAQAAPLTAAEGDAKMESATSEASDAPVNDTLPHDETRYAAPKSLPRPTREQNQAYATRTIYQPAYTLEECAEATGIDTRILAGWVHAIERKGQAILYGPPGTGKTFVAHHLARHLIGGGDGFTETLQFHPAFSYEEFVQGLRPQPGANGLTFAMQPGRFLTFCREAAGRMGVCVLIIDEINRANLAQTLGELLYLLEYREAQIRLAGSDTPFGIPANVRILGTMNSADRSIALVDNALRRRFAFLRVEPDYNILRHYHDRAGTAYGIEPLIALLQEINQAIGDPNYALGISYFLHDDLASDLPSIWQVEIEPYLEEFFFDQPEQVAPLRWAAVKARLGF